MAWAIRQHSVSPPRSSNRTCVVSKQRGYRGEINSKSPPFDDGLVIEVPGAKSNFGDNG